MCFHRENITKNDMFSLQYTIFCIILIALFPLHDFVGGEGLKAGNQPNSFCSPIPCDTKDKTRSCAHCYRPSERKTSFFKSREECAAACKA
ncbi:hypothetical protein YC2023_022629 [Brassica napus]